MKLIRTLLAVEGEGVCSGVAEGGTDCSGELEGEGDSLGVGEGARVGDSCAAVIATQATQKTKVRIWKGRSAIRELSIISPVHVRKNVVAPFAVAQKFFIEIICDKLIVQTVEASKVIDRALGCVFARSPGFHQKCPVT
jgi:hypothetical protein